MLRLVSKAKNINGETIYEFKTLNNFELTLMVNNELTTMQYIIYRWSKEYIDKVFIRDFKNKLDYECAGFTINKNDKSIDNNFRLMPTGIRDTYIIGKPLDYTPFGVTNDEFNIIMKDYIDLLLR